MLDELSLVIITGASQGYGRALAVAFASRVKSKSTVILLARNLKGLVETVGLIDRDDITVATFQADLSKPKVCEEILSEVIPRADRQIWTRGILINNAGSIGNTSLNSKDFTSFDEVNQYMELNVTSPMVLTSRFLKIMENFPSTKNTVVNVSSLCAIQPWKSYGMYGPGKAARDMYFKVLALENPEICVLNWAPGPLDTDMVKDVMKNTCSIEIKNLFQSLYDNKTILTCKQSAEKLCAILEENKFKSGDHVDYYD